MAEAPAPVPPAEQRLDKLAHFVHQWCEEPAPEYHDFLAEMRLLCDDGLTSQIPVINCNAARSQNSSLCQTSPPRTSLTFPLPAAPACVLWLLSPPLPLSNLETGIQITKG
eukprot:880457-Rhodomonas_salina.1